MSAILAAIQRPQSGRSDQDAPAGSAEQLANLAERDRRIEELRSQQQQIRASSLDPKPALMKFDGTPYQGKVKVGSNGRPIGYLAKSAFKFDQYGESGLPISDLFPHTSQHADELCVIRSMHTDTAAHASGCLQMNTGDVQIGSPSLGSWLCYGLGTESQDLPSYVVMTDPRGGPIGSASNWTAGYMPAAYQGTLFRSGGSPLLDLATPEGVGTFAGPISRATSTTRSGAI